MSSAFGPRGAYSVVKVQRNLNVQSLQVKDYPGPQVAAGLVKVGQVVAQEGAHTSHSVRVCGPFVGLVAGVVIQRYQPPRCASAPAR